MHNYTLIDNLSDHPEWCAEPGITRIKDIKLGQVVLDINKTLARVVHISGDTGMMRLALINHTGEFAHISANYESITIYRGERIKLI